MREVNELVMEIRNPDHSVEISTGHFSILQESLQVVKCAVGLFLNSLGLLTADRRLVMIGIAEKLDNLISDAHKFVVKVYKWVTSVPIIGRIIYNVLKLLMVIPNKIRIYLRAIFDKWFRNSV